MLSHLIVVVQAAFLDRQFLDLFSLFKVSQPPQAPEIFYANAAMRSLLTICCTAAVLPLGSTEGCAYKALNLKKLISTGSCPNCDLQNAYLRGASLQGAYAEGAKLDSVVVADWADGIIYFWVY